MIYRYFHFFDGWFLNGSKIEADYVVKQDITLTAKWTEWGTVSSPSFTPAASSVNLDEKISITCATSGAEIHYTTDGSEPTANSTKYTGAITIDDSVSTNNVCTIKAIAIKTGMKPSDVASKTYTIKTYKVTYKFETNADKLLNAPQAEVYRKGNSVTIKTLDEMNASGVCADDYVFEGWYSNKDFTGKKVKTVDVTEPKDIVLYGKCIYGKYVNDNGWQGNLADYSSKTSGLYTFVFGNGITEGKLNPSNETDGTDFCLDFSETKIPVMKADDSVNNGFAIYYHSKEKHVSKVILPPDCTLNGAFSAYCVKTVIIPEGTGNVVIGENAFLSCPNLEKVVFEAKNVTLGVGSFADCKKMTEITLPENLSSILYGTFLFCKALKSITIPASVNDIGMSAFYHSGLIKITFAEPSNWYIADSTSDEDKEKGLPLDLVSGEFTGDSLSDYINETDKYIFRKTSE